MSLLAGIEVPPNYWITMTVESVTESVSSVPRFFFLHTQLPEDRHKQGTQTELRHSVGGPLYCKCVHYKTPLLFIVVPLPRNL